MTYQTDTAPETAEGQHDMKSKLPLVIAGGVGLALLGMLGSKVGGKKGGFKSHDHKALEHTHEHLHVTHNRSEPGKGVGGWEHLTSAHTHAHNHPAVVHSHRAHRDLDAEHKQEAHVHDHEHPTHS